MPLPKKVSADDIIHVLSGRTFYQPYLDPRPLSAAQKAEIAEYIAEIAPPGAELWFATVRWNDTERYSITVYLVPDNSVGRYQSGRCTSISSSLIPIIRELSEMPNPPPGLGKKFENRFGRYTQVLNAPRPFSLDVPSSDELPFGLELELTPEQVTAVIDAARAQLRADESVREEDLKTPVLWLQKEEAETIGVYFGWSAGPLAGGGRSVRVKRVPGGFKAVPGVGLWVS